MRKLRVRGRKIAALWLIAAALSVPARATPIVTNGSFEQSSNGLGYLSSSNTLTGWTVNSTYSFLVAGSNSTQLGDGGYGNTTLWVGPGASPDGGDFIASDGAFQTGSITQTLTGLTVGTVYQIFFYQAAGQQSGFTGATTEWWTVGFGNQSQNSTVMDDASESEVGWMTQSLNFEATSTTEVLSFLAGGTPDGEPPFSLLDGVSATAIPEPASLATMMGSLLGLIALRRFKKPRAATCI